jgi:hypothetical protein
MLTAHPGAGNQYVRQDSLDQPHRLTNPERNRLVQPPVGKTGRRRGRIAPGPHPLRPMGAICDGEARRVSPVAAVVILRRFRGRVLPAVRTQSWMRHRREAPGRRRGSVRHSCSRRQRSDSSGVAGHSCVEVSGQAVADGVQESVRRSEKREDVVGGTGLAELREDVRDGVVVGSRVAVDQWEGRARRVRSVTVIRTRTTLTPTMTPAMRCTPWSETRVWKTMPVMAEAAIEPR